MNWKNPDDVRRYYRLRARMRRARCKAAKLCHQCRAPMETRGLCSACLEYRRKRYHLVVKPQLAIGAKPYLDCGRTCQRYTSVRCQRCHCRRAGQSRWTKGQAA